MSVVARGLNWLGTADWSIGPSLHCSCYLLGCVVVVWWEGEGVREKKEEEGKEKAA